MDSPDSRRIVVGVDGSEHSRLALRWAAHLAQPEGAVIEAVYAWQRPVRYATTPGLAYLEWTPDSAAEKLLGETVDEVFGPNRPPDIHLVAVEGYPPKVLADVGADAYLLVVGRRGHTGLAARLLGSVSASVLKLANCPVLVVHNTEPPQRKEQT